MERTLRKHFGYFSLWTGQLRAIQSLLTESPRDVVLFWSTGSSKSLCYQIPSLHTNKIALIISPLISLIEDQVVKLNGLSSSSSTDIAVFLGSG